MRLIDELPGRAAIARAVETWRRRVLYERVDAVRVAWCNRDGNLAERVIGSRQAVSGDPGPRRARVVRDIDPAAQAAAVQIVAVNDELPHAGVQRLRIGRIDREIRAAGVVVDGEHVLPRRTAVTRVKDAALALRA